MAFRCAGLTAIAFLLAAALASESKPKEEAADEKEEVQPSKRQALYSGIPSGQYGQQQEVPPEFLNYLQQLTEQQAAQLPGAPPPLPQGQPQQLLAARIPPQAVLQAQPQPGFPQYRVAPAPPAVPRLSPQAEEQRRLQQEYADRPLREQQQRALQQLFQPAQNAYRLPLYAAQAQQTQQQAAQQQIAQQHYSPEELRALAEQQYIAYEQPQYVEQQVAHQPQPQPQLQSQPQKYSYSQIQFGSQPTSHHKVRSQPQPQPSQTLYYSQQPEYYSPEQQTPTHPQLPEQYLIETSKPQHTDERVVAIPRPKAQPGHPSSVYYRAQQIQPQSSKYVDDNVLRSTTATPARSSIYVTKSGQDAKQALHYTLGESLQQRFGGLNHLNLPDSRPSSQHPLSQTELNSLLQAGFQISSSPLESRRSLLSGPNYRQQQAKRHSKRVPSPVQLTEDERHELAQQGIRNLYKVESAESQNAPVTYVLAIDGNLKNGKQPRRSP